MKVLLWGVYSPWTINFVENFLLKNNHEIWILNRGKLIEYKKYMDFYKKNNIHLIEFSEMVSRVYDKKGEKNYFEMWYSRFLQLKEVVKSGPYDLINMQYIEPSDLIDVVILKYIMRTRLILSYWGSDLLRIKDKDLATVGKYVRCADFVTFDNEDLKIKFKKIYQWSNEIPSKTILFGLPILDIIEQKCKNTTIEELREKWNIPKNKSVIAIGYNGIPEQQHKIVLKVIEKLESIYKEKIFLLLQMSYGGTTQYKKQVIAEAKKTNCDYLAIQDFLTNEEVAELRIVTDIFINAQTTDAFSGSVCENLFSGTTLINARWLRYKEFEKYDFRFLEFEKISDIGKLIKIAIEQKVDISKNKELVWKLRSWKYCSQRWEKLYQKNYKR